MTGVYERCGAYQGVVKPGCTFLGPDLCGVCIDNKLISTRVTESITKCETRTKDNVFVRIDCAVQQMPKEGKIKEVIYKLRTPSQQIDSYVADVIRAKVPVMSLDEVFQNKDAIADAVNEKLKEQMEDFGWEILQALVINVEPDRGVKAAMNKVETARKERAAAETRAEADKYVSIKAAEAHSESQALQGLGIARQRDAIVQGLRNSVGADTSLDAQVVSELLLITQYFDTLEKMSAAPGNTIFVPYGVGAVASVAKQIRSGVMEPGSGGRR